MTDRKKGRMKIFQDEVKLRHTTHWDVDTLSRAEFEAYMQGKLDLPSQNVRETAALDAVTQDPGPASDCRANAGDSLWNRFMKACLSR